MYKAAVTVEAGRPLEMREYPKPKMEPGSILLQTIYSEVCGTDVNLYHGRLAAVPYPIIPGHVSVGGIAQVAGEARDVEGDVLREGGVVTFLDVHGTCGPVLVLPGGQSDYPLSQPAGIWDHLLGRGGAVGRLE